MKKQILSMLLAIVMVVGLVPTHVLAAECTHDTMEYDDQTLDYITHKLVCQNCEEYEWENHYDDNSDGKCDVCQLTIDAYGKCVHDGADAWDGETLDYVDHWMPCTLCGGYWENHYDGNDDGKCDACHISIDENNRCVHTDANTDRYCDVCGSCVHSDDTVWDGATWDDFDHLMTCTVCGGYWETHYDDDNDDLCDVCSYDMSDTSGGEITLPELPADTAGKIIVLMSDEYGDTWNDAAINIYKNGELAGTASMTEDDGNTAVYEMEYDSTATYRFTWVEGEYDNECDYAIYIDGAQYTETLETEGGSPDGGETSSVASVTVGDTTTNYADIASAVEAAQCSSGSTLMLLDDITVGSDGVYISDGDFTIDLNGFSLTSDHYVLQISKSNITLTDTSEGETGGLFVKIEGDPNPTTEYAAIVVDGYEGNTQVTIEKGTYSSDISGGTAISMICSAVTINGGTFYGTAAANYQASLDIYDGTFYVTNGDASNVVSGSESNVIIYGGSFSGTADAFYNAAGATLTVKDDAVVSGNSDEGYADIYYVGGIIDLSEWNNADGATIQNYAGEITVSDSNIKLPADLSLLLNGIAQTELASGETYTIGVPAECEALWGASADTLTNAGTFADAIAAAEEKNGGDIYIQLQKDIAVPDGSKFMVFLLSGTTLTLDFNSYTISAGTLLNHYSTLFDFYINGDSDGSEKLILRDRSGSVEPGGIYVSTGSPFVTRIPLVVEDGVYEGSGSSYVESTTSAEIEGGTFRSTESVALSVRRVDTLTICGGTFSTDGEYALSCYAVGEGDIYGGTVYHGTDGAICVGDNSDAATELYLYGDAVITDETTNDSSVDIALEYENAESIVDMYDYSDLMGITVCNTGDADIDADIIALTGGYAMMDENGDVVTTLAVGKTYTVGEAYKVSIAEDIDNGTVTADKAGAKPGETVTLTITPDSGYQLEEVSINGERDRSVFGKTEYSFTMPAENVHVYALFKEGVVVYFDNSESQWTHVYYDYGEEGYGAGIVLGNDLYGFIVPENQSGRFTNHMTGMPDSAHPEGIFSTEDITPVAGKTYFYITPSTPIMVVEAATGEALAGASMQLIDSTGAVVDEWTSGEDVYEVTGLKTGEQYTLYAAVAPDGYTIPTDTTFTIGADGEITYTGTVSVDGTLLVEFDLTVVKLSAADAANGKEIEGAHLQILDADGSVVEEWVSAEDDDETDDVDESVYTVIGLKTGVAYTLHAVAAPDGYTVTTDTAFSINEDGKLRTTGIVTEDDVILSIFEMTEVKISAVDVADDSALAGVTMQILDADGSVVEEWVSEADVEETVDVDESIHMITGLKTDEEFTLRAAVAPVGYTIPADTTFSIDKNGVIIFDGNINVDDVLLVEFAKAVAITEDMITVDLVAYTGAQQIPGNNIIVRYNGMKLTLNEDYYIQTSDAYNYTDAGDHPVKIIGMGSYTGAVETTFTIEKAPIGVYTVPTVSSIWYGQTLADSTITDGQVDSNVPGGETNIAGTWTWNDRFIMPYDSGEYPATFTPDNANYQSFVWNLPMQLNQTTPDMEITATPEKPLPNDEVTVSVSVTNPYNTALTDVPAPEVYYQIGNGGLQKVADGKFTIPDKTPEGTVVRIIAQTLQSTQYMTKTAEITITTDVPKITSVTFNSDSPAYDAATNTFTIDEEHPLIITVEGRNLRGAKAWFAAANTQKQIMAYISNPFENDTSGSSMIDLNTYRGLLKSMEYQGYQPKNIAYIAARLKFSDLSVNDLIPLNVVERTYDVELRTVDGGEVSTDKENPVKGDEVTITVTPDEGKEVDKVIVKDASGNEVTVTDNGDGTYTYEQPAGDITVEVAFKNIPATGHSYSTEWSKDASGHWHECACGDKADFAAHTPGAEATETTAQTCTICGYEINPALGHVHSKHLTKTDAEPATCTEPGNTAYWTCSCGKYFSDENATTEIAKDSWVIPAIEHVWDDEWTFDDTYHWHVCENEICDITEPSGMGGFTVHVYDEEVDIICNDCGYVRTIETVPMFRLYNPNSGEHFYTGSEEERDILVAAGWHYEGVAWNAPVVGGVPVHRLYNPNSGDHFYTTHVGERDHLISLGWRYEGVAWNDAGPSGGHVPQFRLWNPNADMGSHHYTSSEEERDWLVSLGWIYEGVAWHGTLQ